MAKKIEPDSFSFFCEGCGCSHLFYTTGTPAWKFNGNMDKPTFEPSLLYRWHEGGADKVCHLFLRNGEVQYLTDCTHKLAGKNVPVKEFSPVGNRRVVIESMATNKKSNRSRSTQRKPAAAPKAKAPVKPASATFEDVEKATPPDQRAGYCD